MKILVCEPHKHPYVKDIPHELREMQAVVGGLTDSQIETYKARFWDPEMLIPTPDGMARIIVKEI